MSRPSDALLRWLRRQLDAQGLNTASLAGRLGRPRAEVRKLLSGSEPMLVDDLLRITELLELTADDVGLPSGLDVTSLEAALEGSPEPLHWDNQPRALFRFGLDLGIDFLFLSETVQLEGWGGPDQVLAQHKGKEMPLRLDAAYHQYMEPALDDRGVSLTLSFDQLYRCTFPWTAITRVIFMPFPPKPPEVEEEEPEEAPPPGPPKLRLVT